ncbi:hypothetical protein GmHk_07G019686 [Glycine max]|nr:hypothetical protein GmHk_07G019686 [Glycine max]
MEYAELLKPFISSNQCYQWRMAEPEHGRRPKFHHINTPLRLMAPPWWAFLHKLPMVIGKKSATSFCHSGAMAAI